MPLDRAQIVAAARELLTRNGLAGLTMRQLAQELGVQPGALYYHVASKQELLVAVAEHILDGGPPASHADGGAGPNPADGRLAASEPDDATAAALSIRATLLPIRDSAEVVSFVNAFRPFTLVPFQALERLFAAQLPAVQAHWAAETLIHYILGFVAQEQNQAELIRARIVPTTDADRSSEQAFRFGVEAILRGLKAGGAILPHAQRETS